MFKLSRQVEYALMALSDLSESGDSLSVNEISQKRGISKNTLSKTMQTLQLGNLIESKQGIAGGYTSNSAKIKELSLYDLLILFGEIKKLGCSSDQELCNIADQCNIKTPLKVWESKFETFLKSTPLENFMNRPSQLKESEL